jgi:hypothetical protein
LVPTPSQPARNPLADLSLEDYAKALAGSYGDRGYHDVVRRPELRRQLQAEPAPHDPETNYVKRREFQERQEALNQQYIPPRTSQGIAEEKSLAARHQQAHDTLLRGESTIPGVEAIDSNSAFLGLDINKPKIDENASELHKAYTTFSDYREATPERFHDYATQLQQRGFQGTIKTSAMNRSRWDNFVAHGQTEQDTELAAKTAQDLWAEQGLISQVLRGKDVRASEADQQRGKKWISQSEQTANWIERKQRGEQVSDKPPVPEVVWKAPQATPSTAAPDATAAAAGTRIQASTAAVLQLGREGKLGTPGTPSQDAISAQLPTDQAAESGFVDDSQPPGPVRFSPSTAPPTSPFDASAAESLSSLRYVPGDTQSPAAGGAATGDATKDRPAGPKKEQEEAQDRVTTTPPATRQPDYLQGSAPTTGYDLARPDTTTQAIWGPVAGSVGAAGGTAATGTGSGTGAPPTGTPPGTPPRRRCRRRTSRWPGSFPSPPR